MYIRIHIYTYVCVFATHYTQTQTQRALSPISCNTHAQTKTQTQTNSHTDTHTDTHADMHIRLSMIPDVYIYI